MSPVTSIVALKVFVGLALVLITFEFHLLIGAPLWSRGQDYLLYNAAAHRWLDTGAFYQQYQLAGPYVIPEGAAADAVLYPPPILLLLAPFTFLPAALWWLVPAAIVVFALTRLRPTRAAAAVMLALVAWPTSMGLIWTGNPVIWLVAAGMLGARYSWPAVAIFMKPTLAPFAFIGANSRSWWLTVAVSCLVALAFMPLWLQWVTAVTNAQGPRATLLYSLGDVPLLLIPVVAFLGRERRDTPASQVSTGVEPAGNVSARLARAFSTHTSSNRSALEADRPPTLLGRA
jgi:hypothetical protein